MFYQTTLFFTLIVQNFTFLGDHKKIQRLREPLDRYFLLSLFF